MLSCYHAFLLFFLLPTCWNPSAAAGAADPAAGLGPGAGAAACTGAWLPLALAVGAMGLQADKRTMAKMRR